MKKNLTKKRTNVKPKSTLKKVVNLEKRVRAIQNDEEVKYHDFYQTSTVSSNTPTLYNLALIPSSTAPTDRVGNDIQATSLQFKINITPQDTDQLIRFIIFWDVQNNQTTPLVTGGGGQGLLMTNIVTNFCLSPYSREQNKRFRIIYDKTLYMSATNFVGDSKTALYYYSNKFKLSRKIKYAPDGSNDQVTNALWLVIMSENIVGPPYEFMTRLNFKDD